ncbi:MAG: VWA domain-containing protein [Acidobacteria bacterium]|nr:VWA domain-containing protein [Acidobacteriota bacterium]
MKKFVIAILIALVTLPTLAAQDDKPIKLTADLVAVETTVTDKNGNFIRHLKKEDFVVYEDGEPQKLEFFEASEKTEFTRALAVVFAIDISGSITAEETDRQRVAAENFMKLVQTESVFAVVAFNNEIRVLQDFTNDAKKISQAFHKIKEGSGSTRLFATLDRAVTMLKKVPHYRGNRRLRRVVVVVTDGYDNVDSTEQGALITRANDAEVTIYSITLPSYGATGAASNRIMTLLDVSRIIPMTGGADFSADARDFTPVFKAIAEEIQAAYTLAYYPSEQRKRDGRTHQLRVEVKRGGAIVRASRTSYQAVNRDQ